jgi:hypothetical protein
MKKTVSSKEFLRIVKTGPKNAARWLDENAKSGVNFNFSPSVIKEFEKLLDTAVDADGNIDVQAMTGLEVGLAIALAAVVGLVVGYAAGAAGSGGTTVTVEENGDGSVNVNCNDRNGDGGNGGEEEEYFRLAITWRRTRRFCRVLQTLQQSSAHAVHRGHNICSHPCYYCRFT